MMPGSWESTTGRMRQDNELNLVSRTFVPYAKTDLNCWNKEIRSNRLDLSQGRQRLVLENYWL